MAMTATANTANVALSRPNAMSALSEVKSISDDAGMQSGAQTVLQDVLALVPPTMLPLEDHEILVKVEAMLQDPSDWKYIDLVTQEPTHKTHGRDFSGIVVEVGKDARDVGVSVGDQVAGFVLASAVHSATYPDRSDNIFFVRMDAELAWVIPKGTFTHRQAAEARLGRYRYMFGNVPR